MELFGYSIHAEAFTRGAEQQAGALESRGMDVAAPHGMPVTGGAVTGEGIQAEAAARQREEWLEGWMEEVKAFIRNIDVSSL